MSATAADGRRVIVLGGSSEIALATVHELQRRATREVVLVGRDQDALAAAAAALTRAGCPRVETVDVDALATDTHASRVGEAFERLGGADLVVLGVGALGERGGLPADIPAAVEVMQVNLVGSGSLLLHAARHLVAQGGGTLVVLSSVAAQRPRKANAVYGASKAGLDSLAQGLGDALRADGVRVCVVRPGFVATRMTRGLKAAPLSTVPEAVARATVSGLQRGRETVWAPSLLRWVMLLVGLLPRSIFRRLSL